MKTKRVMFLYEGRTNSVFRDTLLSIPLALHRAGVDCRAYDIRHTSDQEIITNASNFKPDFIFQVARVPTGAWRIAHLKHCLAAPLVLWNLEEPNATAVNQLIELAAAVDLYATIDARMLKWHKRQVIHLPLFFDEFVYYERGLERTLGASFLIQMSTPRLKSYILPLIQVLEERGDALVSCYRPMKFSGNRLTSLTVAVLDRLPIEVSGTWAQILKKLGIWRDSSSIEAQGYFVNRDEEEKAFIYGKSKIGIGFSRVFGPWEQALRDLLPGYEKDHLGNCVQLKSRQFEVAGAGALLLSDSSPDLDKMFEPGKEYIPYRYEDPDEFRRLLDYWISNDSARLKVAEAGYKRAHASHTLTCRVNTLLETCDQLW